MMRKIGCPVDKIAGEQVRDGIYENCCYSDRNKHSDDNVTCHISAVSGKDIAQRMFWSKVRRLRSSIFFLKKKGKEGKKASVILDSSS